MKLEQLQASFQAHLLQGDGAILDEVLSSEKLDSATRMQIYAHAYRARLNEVLSTDFPALKRWLGDEAAGVFDRYITTHPSQHFSLRHFGRHMATFLLEDEYASVQPAWSELAAFEWAFCEAFDARDMAVVSVQDLSLVAAQDWPQLCFELHPSLQWLETHYPLSKMWQCKDSDELLPEVARSETAVHFIIWRQPDLASHYRSLADDEAAALQMLSSGGTFTALCVSLLPWHDEQQLALRAASLLKTWVEEGLIAALKH